MWFHSLLNSLKSRSPPIGRRSSSRPTSRLQVEALEDRSVPAAFSDPVGDFLPTYTGPQLPGMDLVAHDALLVGDRVVFSGKMAASVAATQEIGGLCLVRPGRRPGATP